MQTSVPALGRQDLNVHWVNLRHCKLIITALQSEKWDNQTDRQTRYGCITLIVIEAADVVKYNKNAVYGSKYESLLASSTGADADTGDRQDSSR